MVPSVTPSLFESTVIRTLVFESAVRVTLDVAPVIFTDPACGYAAPIACSGDSVTTVTVPPSFALLMVPLAIESEYAPVDLFSTIVVFRFVIVIVSVPVAASELMFNVLVNVTESLVVSENVIAPVSAPLSNPSA